MKNKKLSITVEQDEDGGFCIDFSTGFMSKQKRVAESVDSLISKVSEFLKSQFKDGSK